MKTGSLSALLASLQAVAWRYGPSWSQEKKALLGRISPEPGFTPARLRVYHDCLLGMLAFPDNPEVAARVLSALEGAEAIAAKHLAKKSWQLALSGSGIRGSAITGSFSYTLCRWLDETFPGEAELESSEADPETVRLFFRSILPRIEYESISGDECGLIARIRKLKENSRQPALSWLLRQLDDQPLPEPAKEALFNGLKLFIRWTSRQKEFTRTFMNNGLAKTFYHDSLHKKVSPKEFLSKKLPAPIRLQPQQKTHLVSLARTSLALLYRETEPFTYADQDEIVCYPLERGTDVILFGMVPGRRFALESYIGYLACKNGIPIAYGGGWIFGERCQFGINILPPFRGGESSLLFYQLLRVYHQRFRVTRFVVKPYQFGWHNPEAIGSGAFWFYYKAGFRPGDAARQALAAEEAKRKEEQPGYRTPAPTLKKFTAASCSLDLRAAPLPKTDAAILSRYITDYINTSFHGNRRLAMERAVAETARQFGIRDARSWKGTARAVLADWSLLAQALLKPDTWTAKEKQQFAALIRAKAFGREKDFIDRLRNLKALWRDTKELLC